MMTTAFDKMSGLELRALIALAKMCDQYLRHGDSLDHQCMSAGEDAVELLIEYGLLEPAPRGGTWTEAGLRLLDYR